MKKLFLLATLVTAGSAVAMAPQGRNLLGQPRSALDEFRLLSSRITYSDSQEKINELLGGFIQNIIKQNPINNNSANISPHEKNNFLCDACKRNLPAPIIEALLDWGADVDGFNRENPLWHALHHDADHTVVKLLIDRGAQTNGRFFGQGLLHLALYHWRYKNIAVLLDAGFDAQSVLTDAGYFLSSIGFKNLPFLILYTRHIGRLYSNESGVGLLDIRDVNGKTMLEEAQQANDTASIQLLSNPESTGELYPNAQKEFREIMLEKNGVTNVREYVRNRELER